MSMREIIHRRYTGEAEKAQDTRKGKKKQERGVSNNAAAIKNSSSVWSLYNLAKGGYQSLCQPETEDQLGTGHQQLGSETLEKAGEALILEHV